MTRPPYSPGELARLGELVAREASVDLVFALSPGRSVRYFSPPDREAFGDGTGGAGAARAHVLSEVGTWARAKGGVHPRARRRRGALARARPGIFARVAAPAAIRSGVTDARFAEEYGAWPEAMELWAEAMDAPWTCCPTGPSAPRRTCGGSPL